jgi:predicted nuclease of restriction endonuclease-like (RecB) superfamily
MESNNMELIESVKDLILQSRQKIYRIANSALLETYWEIGRLIVEDEQSGNNKAKYGKATLTKLSEALMLEFGKGYDYTNLTNMRNFYLAFPILDALRQELSWTHYRLLSRLDTGAKRNFYLKEAVAAQWNSRELQRQINALAFERVVKHLPGKESKPSIQNIIKDPYIFEFLGLSPEEKNTERTIETAIINHLQKFLLEFGNGFAFVARQQHIVTDTSDFYIDLVFYNYILKCFVIKI